MPLYVTFQCACQNAFRPTLTSRTYIYNMFLTNTRTFLSDVIYMTRIV